MDNWHREIVELHDFFEAWFLGTADDHQRVEAALADDFTMVGPTGVSSDRDEVVQAIVDGRAHTDSLTIEIHEPELVFETEDLLIAEYIETHVLRDWSNHRRSTVVFRQDADGPNGLRWLRVHESWIDRGIA